MGTTVSVMGGNSNIYVGGNGTVYAGSGNDTIDVTGNGLIKVGQGADKISLGKSGSIVEHGSSGYDTINLGSGTDTIFEAGHATVNAHFGSAQIHDGQLIVFNSGSNEIAVSGNATLLGGSHGNEFTGGTGSVFMQGGTAGADTFVGGSGHDTMVGGGGKNYFEFFGGGSHVINNFVSGQDKLYVEGMSFTQLQADISYKNGNAYINVGNTHIELVNVPKNSLTSTDIIKHPK